MERKLSQPLLLFSLCFTVFLCGFINVVFATELFSDGFESGDFSAWTNIVQANGAITAEGTLPHHGSYDAKCEMTEAEAWENALAYKTYTAAPTVYTRVYIYIDAFKGGNAIRGFINHFSVFSGQMYAQIGITAGRALNLRYWNGATIATDTSATVLSLDTRYCLELETTVSDAGAGTVHVYLNGSEIGDITQTGLTNKVGVANIGDSEVGVSQAYSDTATVYFDCVVVDTSYIGVEGAGQDLTFALTETAAATTSVVMQKELKFQSIISTEIASLFIQKKELGFLSSETASSLSSIVFNKEFGFNLVESFVSSGGLEASLELGMIIFQFAESFSTQTETFIGKEIAVSIAQSLDVEWLMEQGIEIFTGIEVTFSEVVSTTSSLIASFEAALPPPSVSGGALAMAGFAIILSMAGIGIAMLLTRRRND